MLSLITLATLFHTALVAATCNSYGIDYQEGGKYFLSKQSPAQFQAFEKFQGCTNDKAHNIIVDPNGDESECTETDMQPDGTPRQLTCPGWTYNKLYTGDWSIIIISNNGNQDPIAYQRDFHLTIVEDPASGSIPTPATTSPAVQDPPASTTNAGQAFTFTFPFAKRHEAEPTTFSRVTVRKNETLSTLIASMAASSSAEPTTTIETTMTSHVTSFLTLFPSATHVPFKVGGHNGGWNSTVTSPSAFPTGTGIPMPLVTGTGNAVQGLRRPTGHLAPRDAPASYSAPAVAPDHIAAFAPSVLGEELESLAKSVIAKAPAGTYSAEYKQALLSGNKPSPELKKMFVEERRKTLAGLA